MSKREIVIRRNSPRSSLPSPSSSMPSLTMVEEIFHMIRRRRTLLTEEEDEKCEGTNDSQRYCLRRQVFQAFEDAISNQSTADETDSDDSSAEKKADKIDKAETNTVSEYELEDDSDSSFDFGGFLRFSRRIFGNLMALDYCENVPPNLIWCGYLRISHSQLAGMNYSEPIKVALVVHPRRWSMKEIRLWRNATTFSMSKSANEEEPIKPPTVKANVIPHNFQPVGPNRGRLIGLTESGRRTLRELADGLNRSGMVARFSNTTVSSIPSSTTADLGRQFTVKLVAFDQAERKLETIFRRGYEPGGIPLREEKESMVLHSTGDVNCDSISSDAGINDDSNSLLCCWNHEFLWEDSKSFRME
eukprot:CAMPEP_0116121502 /NCGR_PEP_ID=MMETSP0329-20121206/3731_1 /TAXON_ID=697910 /ORGANISM="Pseudo-nitzschia arenysensis, Strain B593" /LENGTH=359 /DNA_ID=CAMNT_0003615319 /DNA_START=212 /DNA_END=1288 /DNA_ORIENTATION=-